jgi:hypothetical protein
MLNLDIIFIVIILESCSLEFCGAPLKNPIDLALSKVGTLVSKLLKYPIKSFS